MRILMLGWEFPPFISGGLGTACYGLTRALDRLGQRVIFVLPRAVEGDTASHVELVSPEAGAPDAVRSAEPSGGASGAAPAVTSHRLPGFERTEFVAVPSVAVSPYPDPETGEAGTGRGVGLAGVAGQRSQAEVDALREAGIELTAEERAGGLAVGGGGADYAGDVVTASREYAKLVTRLCAGREFDVIHAHDWMTYPAGMTLARVTGKPLITHIHSTEFDRSGEHVNQAVYDIERRGMHGALRVIAVSALTKSIVATRYGVDAGKIDVVYNGIETADDEILDRMAIEPRDKIVLFLGRITMQKGPEYFVGAAKRVLEVMPNVKFLVAGSGDMAVKMIEQAAAAGIGHRVLFTGFLRGKDVERIFQMADLYVMPSVSEPFGIAPLEAMTNGTPALISKQSGVSEVLSHVLKVDFWDVDEMANKILAVLRHAPLQQTLRKHGRLEVRKLTWEGAAQKCVGVYERCATGVLGGMWAQTH
jgi:glycogen(starch) synthase